MRLTGRGIALLATAITLYVVGSVAGFALFRALGGVGVGAVIAALALTVRRPSVEVRREVYPDRVECGRSALATLRVRNTGAGYQPAFLAQDSAGGVRQRVEIRRAAPGTEATYRYELPTTKRGRQQVGPLTLERPDPLGLARNRIATGETATLWVHPRRHAARTLTAGRPRHHHEGRTADDSLRGSADLRDVRPYVVGDEVRHLHWKATARTGQLMVRDFADPDQPRLSVLLDTRVDALSTASFEQAVEVAASLVFPAAMNGHHCRLLTSAGADLGTAGGPLAARLMLDELAEVRQAPAGPLLPLSSGRSAGRSAGGAIVVVTGPNGTPAEIAPLLLRYSSVRVVALGPYEGVLGARVIQADTAADAVRQWNELV